MAEKNSSDKWYFILLICIVGLLIIGSVANNYIEVLRLSSLTPEERQEEKRMEEIKEKERLKEEQKAKELAEEQNKIFISDMQTLVGILKRNPLFFLMAITPIFIVILFLSIVRGRFY